MKSLAIAGIVLLALAIFAAMIRGGWFWLVILTGPFQKAENFTLPMGGWLGSYVWPCLVPQDGSEPTLPG
jgi:hypothetical protein